MSSAMNIFFEEHKLKELEVNKIYLLERHWIIISGEFKVLKKNKTSYTLENIKTKDTVTLYFNETIGKYNFYYKEPPHKTGVNVFELKETKIFLLEQETKNLEKTILEDKLRIKKNERKVMENIVEIASLKNS